MLCVSRLLSAALIVMALLAPTTAFAGDDSDTFTVSADVLATCDVSANDLDFGDYNPVTGGNLDASTTISLTCTNGTAYQVGLDLGGGAGASMATRYMVNGANTLGYTLYQNGGRTTLWGLSTNRLAGVGTGAAASIDVFGRIPMHQAAPAGAYSDTITVTVSW